jgi:hypothetical protein
LSLTHVIPFVSRAACQLINSFDALNRRGPLWRVRFQLRLSPFPIPVLALFPFVVVVAGLSNPSNQLSNNNTTKW